MKLTPENYFTSDNKYISNSDRKNYKKCKKFFKDKKDGVIETSITDALITGSAVDEWLTNSKKSFEAKYHVMPRRSKKGDIPYRYQLTKTMLENIVQICEAVEATTAYKEIIKEGHLAQQILQYDVEIGEFEGICGIPDWFHIDKNGLCTITDLKTAASIKGDDIASKKRAWLYKCLDFNYFHQQGFYQLLLEKLHPEITSFKSRHLIVEKDTDGINTVYAWYLDQTRIEDIKLEIRDTLEDINQETEFVKIGASWNEDEVVGEYEE